MLDHAEPHDAQVRLNEDVMMLRIIHQQLLNAVPIVWIMSHYQNVLHRTVHRCPSGLSTVWIGPARKKRPT